MMPKRAFGESIVIRLTLLARAKAIAAKPL